MPLCTAMRMEKQFAGSAKRTPKTLSAIHETALLRDGFSNSGSDELTTISFRTRLWITDLVTKGKNMEFLFFADSATHTVSWLAGLPSGNIKRI